MLQKKVVFTVSFCSKGGKIISKIISISLPQWAPWLYDFQWVLSSPLKYKGKILQVTSTVYFMNAVTLDNKYQKLSLILMHLSSAFPGRGTPGLPGWNQLKLKKSAPQYRGLSGLLGLFLARGLGTFSGFSGWLPLSLLIWGFVNMFLISPRWRLCFEIMPEGLENWVTLM